MQTLTDIVLHKQRQIVALHYADTHYELSAEYLRVHSPSADVRGHGSNSGTLPLDKANVRIENLEAQGNYGLKLYFSDNHNTGIYTWSYLYELATHKEPYWQRYLQQAELQKTGATVLQWK